MRVELMKSATSKMEIFMTIVRERKMPEIAPS